MIILKRPIITEKSMKLAQSNFYTFEVAKDASKPQIAKSVSEKFSVKVLSVKTINVKGETKTQRTIRKFYQTSPIKKAVVKIAKGEKIALFETPKEEEVTPPFGGAEREPIILKEKKDILGRTKVRVEKGATGAAPTTQRKVITGK